MGKGYASEDLIQALKGNISVLTGQSGAGKSLPVKPDSTLPFIFKAQEISKALGRGKHTTRHCELHEIAGGWVADTPGFSSLDFTAMNITQLAECIPVIFKMFRMHADSAIVFMSMNRIVPYVLLLRMGRYAGNAMRIIWKS